MASEEQIECAALMRKLHRQLRGEAARCGAEAAWREHVQRRGPLRQYATAMRRLGQLWAKAPPPATSRLSWLQRHLDEYHEHGREHQAERERAAAQRLELELPAPPSVPQLPLRVLDVGSCYNPLADSPTLNIIPIDLQPATPDVLQCDFLQVSIGDRLIVEEGAVLQLDEGAYDAVIFSLLLEYLPTPEQRLQCCKTAYDLLKFEGILAIVSPDSKHVGANAKIYKNWRYALSFLGFSRIIYEKSTYLHCMMFRKSLHPKIPERWATLNAQSYMNGEINIPQDFHNNLEDDEDSEATYYDPVSTVELFDELPNFD